MVAILDFQMSTSEPFEQIQSSILESKLISPKPITETFFESSYVTFGIPMTP